MIVCLWAALLAAAPPPASQPAFQPTPAEFLRRVRAIERRRPNEFARYVELQWWKEAEARAGEWARWFEKWEGYWSRESKDLIARRTAMIQHLAVPRAATDEHTDIREFGKAVGQGALCAVALAMQARRTLGKHPDAWAIVPEDLARANDAYTAWMEKTYPHRAAQIREVRRERTAWVKMQMMDMLQEDTALRRQAERLAAAATQESPADQAPPDSSVKVVTWRRFRLASGAIRIGGQLRNEALEPCETVGILVFCLGQDGAILHGVTATRPGLGPLETQAFAVDLPEVPVGTRTFQVEAVAHFSSKSP